jgi:hypothetical protein
MNASDLEPGDRLRAYAGTAAAVVSVRSYSGARNMYDLTVGDTHTYYVAVAAAAVLVHNVNCFGLPVPYNRTELSRLAHQYRVAIGMGLKGGKNIAVAKVKVDGVDDVLYGVSKGIQGDKWIHSEDVIIEQIDALRAEGKTVGRITDLYSDRQVCFTCQDHLDGYLADDVEVTFAVHYGDESLELADLLNRQSATLLQEMLNANR